MKLLSIDTETTGLDHKSSEILELGIVIFDSEKEFRASNENCLRVVFCKNQIQGNIFAINMNIDLLNEINKYCKLFYNSGNTGGVIIEKTNTLTTIYVDTEERPQENNYITWGNRAALARCASCIKEFINNAGVTGKYNIAGKNFVGFDKDFICKYDAIQEIIVENSRHRVLDVGSMYVEPSDDCLPNLSQCLERAGLPHDVPHNAVDDAILVVKAAQAKWLPKSFSKDGTNFIGIPTLEQLG